MIKLNNKNITYVALADSNNSLKAPKEIWYADSNNSVKLVYRRKDALIEGEDYEKYHWLNGDGSAYIDTDINIYKETISTILYPHLLNGTDKYVWVSYNSVPKSEIRAYVDSKGSFTIRQGLRVNDTPPQLCYLQLTGEFDITIKRDTDTNTIFTNNGVAYNRKVPCDDRFDIISKNHLLCESAKVRSFRTDNYNLIPCKLLKPVPKWLDANGIRRQVGECGMIDLVSGKFYGNVNSVGTFTVENYYERKEWLVADIPISTNMMTLPVNSDTLYFKRIWKSFGNSSYFLTDKYDYYTYFYQKKVSIYDSVGSDILGHFGSTINVDEVIEVDSNSERMIMHNVEVPKYGFPITSMRLNNGSNGVDSVTHYTSVISVNGVERYIPCTLTMDLPASMDANNIARTKGTSGMWDLVSDRFYGNVANSGTFKAVNLAEGVDYEVHQWLRAEVPHGVMMSLALGSYDFEFKRKYISLDAGNSYYFIEGNRHYFTTPSRVLVRIAESSSTVFMTEETFEFGESITVRSTNSSLTFNSISIPLPSSPIAYLKIASSSIADKIDYLTSSITVDGIERYIPVKLLKSIPSKYDANGIARQVGECGMYDTVNDVFYGNVANSGTFTVSDDE